jgi:hypothetical protein
MHIVCVLCVPESLCIVCTWVIVYCVYPSHCLLCVPESLCIVCTRVIVIVCTWVTAYCVYPSHCVLCVLESLCIVCTWVTVYFRRQKSFNKKRSEQSVILFSNKIFHTFYSFSDDETKVTYCSLLDEKVTHYAFLDYWWILYFKHSPCSVCCMFSSG